MRYLLTKLCIKCYNLRIINLGEKGMAKKRLTISLAEEVYKELEELAKNAGLSKSAYITTLVINTGKEK